MTNPTAATDGRADIPPSAAAGPPPDSGAPGSDGPNPPGGSAARDHLARLRQRTENEVRRLVADYHARLPRDQAVALGAAYARFSSRYQDSVVDQVRTILDDALRKRVFVPLEFIYFDLGVRGTKADRPGLNALRGCLAARAVQVVFFFSTNRLARKVHHSLQFVEEQVVERGIRAVFVRSGIDTADAKRWRGLLGMHAMMDEFVVGMTADHVRAAHEGLLEKRLVFGTVSYGYCGRSLDGQTTRRGKPRMALVVDPVAGGWVKQVFVWYVVDRVPIDEIARRLNADPAPPPPRSPNRTWTHDAVRKLLRNPRYRGCWRYGATETVWVSSKDYARQVARREPLKEVQIEDLRLILDDQWYQAQALLVKEAGKVARRKPRDGDAASRPRMLNGLFYCPTHTRRLYVGGVHGKYMVCKDCRGLPADRRPLFSQLPRVLALRRLCDTLAGLIRADADLVGRVTDACRHYAARQQAPDPDRVAALEARLAKRDQRIKFIIRNPGETEADQAESAAELRRLRKERADDQAVLDALRAASAKAVAVPDDDEVAALVAELPDVLAAVVDDPGPESAGLVRELIDRLTGGRIDLEQVGERRARRGWLRGRFLYRLVETLTWRLTGVEVTGDGGEGVEVVIDFRPAPVGVPASVAAEVVALYEAGVLEKEIARRLGLARSTVTRILDERDEARGVDRPDGRTRRTALADKHIDPPPYRVAADRVKALADRGLLFGEIAAELGLDRNTVTAAWKFWHESRGLPIPDGRARRKTLSRKSGADPTGGSVVAPGESAS
jgi:DNA invertase Pin-like site-specific DNA recombinase